MEVAGEALQQHLVLDPQPLHQSGQLGFLGASSVDVQLPVRVLARDRRVGLDEPVEALPPLQPRQVAHQQRVGERGQLLLGREEGG